MEEKQRLDFLLGALAPCGFAGYFDKMLGRRGGWRSLLIKAGPGCGKSTMMAKEVRPVKTVVERDHRLDRAGTARLKGVGGGGVHNAEPAGRADDPIQRVGIRGAVDQLHCLAL